MLRKTQKTILQPKFQRTNKNYPSNLVKVEGRAPFGSA